jgi:hypothetical protein
MDADIIIKPGEENTLPDGDYVLDAGAGWFAVQNLSIRIHETDEGVVVDIYRRGAEGEPAIASTYAFFNEGKQEEE